MTIDDKIKDEKLRYDINRKAAILSRRIDKCENLTDKEILPSDESRIIEQAKFTYSPLSKAFESQIQTIEEQGVEQAEALKVLKLEENKGDIKSIEGNFPKETRTNEVKYETYGVKK